MLSLLVNNMHEDDNVDFMTNMYNSIKIKLDGTNTVPLYETYIEL